MAATYHVPAMIDLRLRVPSILFLMFLGFSGYGHSQTVRGIWIGAEELASLPMSGPAWDRLKAQADAPTNKPNVSDQMDSVNVHVLAKALVYARTGIEKYRAEVIQLCMNAINTEMGGMTLALGRNLAAYVIAADLVGLPAAQNERFRNWLRLALTRNLSGRTLRSTHEMRPNNWGTHAGASRAAVAAYLGDTAELARTAQVFKGWLGDRSAYAGFSYGDYLENIAAADSWQCDLSRPAGINSKGCSKRGYSIDGVLPDDQRRGGGFKWPPPKENYVWEALQGALVQAEILHRAGYDVYNWSDQALLRAYLWLHDQAKFPAEGDDQWQTHIVNFRYGTGFPARVPARFGKNMGWTDWTHGAGRAAGSADAPPSQSETAPAPPPVNGASFRVEQNDGGVGYHGNWYTNKNSAHSEGTAAFAIEAGARATFTFVGTAVKWIGLADHRSGIATVYLDGIAIAEVDTYRDDRKNSFSRLVLYSVDHLPHAVHTIAVEAAGRKHPASGGHRVWVDAFDYESSAHTSAVEASSPLTDFPRISTAITGSEGPLRTGYARIHTSDGSPTPIGGRATLTLFGDFGIAAQAALPASALTDSGRIHVETDGRTSTGIALANPNDEVSTVQFFLSERDGRNGPSGSFQLQPGTQISRYTWQEPFNIDPSWAGTLTFDSSLPIGVTSVQAHTNTHGDFLFNAIPVADLTPFSSDPVVIPYFASGMGWRTEVLLINPTDESISGEIRAIGGFIPPTSYRIAARASVRIPLPYAAESLLNGALQVVSQDGSAAPAAASILSLEADGVTLSRSSFQGVDAGSGFTVLAEEGPSGTLLAIANTGGATWMAMEFSSQGKIQASGDLEMAANSHLLLRLSDLPGFQSVGHGLEGVLRIRSASPGIAVAAIEQNWSWEGALLLSTVPALDHDRIHPNSRFVFPHFASGAGFQTRFAIIDRPSVPAAWLHIHTNEGNLLEMPVPMPEPVEELPQLRFPEL